MPMDAFAFKELHLHRELLAAWTVRTVRARYKQSVLGGLWAILQPAATVAIFTVIFTLFIPIDTANVPYVLFAYSAMAPWTFFSTAITDMVDALTVNMNLVSKIYFPREVLPIAAMLARLLDFAIAASVLLIIMLFYGWPILAASWVYLPLIVTVQLALILGVGLIGAACNVFYRDVKHLFALGLQIWLYATPIVYPITVVPEHLRWLYFLNPMAGIIEAYRAVLLQQQAPASTLVIAAIIAAFMLAAGYLFFKRVEAQFADLV
ncbi:MAG: ABC transporter permease [Caldilineaceae bacterium]|nr:ABC transporter permease [Caldilineaceae bacterium]